MSDQYNSIILNYLIRYKHTKTVTIVIITNIRLLLYYTPYTIYSYIYTIYYYILVYIHICNITNIKYNLKGHNSDPYPKPNGVILDEGLYYQKEGIGVNGLL